MPKLPVINYKKLTKVLKGLDFFEHRQSGSHLIMKHQDGRRDKSHLYLHSVTRSLVRE